ncbi:MAG: DEAD/DEAH box helicase family protein [Candidatus Nanopelagicales bacterium]
MRRWRTRPSSCSPTATTWTTSCSRRPSPRPSPGAPLPEVPVQAESRQDLKDLLTGRQSGGIVFTTIQKFGLSKDDREAGIQFPLLSDRANIVVMVDEAHRSNYDFIDGFARHLRDGLPNATFIGFTGTPIEAKDRSTTEVFGDYIDTYDLTQAVEDGATVKVLYEPRLAKVRTARRRARRTSTTRSPTPSPAPKRRPRSGSSPAGRGSRPSSAQTKRLEELAARHRGPLGGPPRTCSPAKCMVVTMSRRIAVALYDEIIALRPDWHDRRRRPRAGERSS